FSYKEIQKWDAYRRKRGSLNIGLRVEEVMAELKLMFASSKGVKGLQIYDYLPHFDKPAPLTFEQERLLKIKNKP
ncbi:hypothetical protein, partial [Acinetobacter baumannii]|uniref:hypothetical protein n=1 Tax=Acinetobacter baumannii TaxID=470 RepID=UPI00312C85DB